MTQGKLVCATASVAFVFMGAVETLSPALAAPGPTSFFPLAPCRVIDTRLPDGPLAGPALVAGADRAFPIYGVCGIPAAATAVSVNLAVAGATVAGNLRLHPGGTAIPLVSALNFAAGQIRSNHAVAPLSPTGELAAFVGAVAGTVHFILDVNGYFAPANPVNETDLPAEADFCSLQFPATLSVQATTGTGPIYGRLFEAGVTPPVGAPTWTAQQGYGPNGVNPAIQSGWMWFPAAYNVQVGNDDEFQGSFTAPAAGTYSYTYRFSPDGIKWTYCDLNGAGSNPGLTFETTQLGVMTVTP